jgi:hypothetical protein
MKKYIFIVLLLLVLLTIACGGTGSSSKEFESSSTIYEMSDVTAVGWKMKKGFRIAEFPDSTDAKWGFAPGNGREVAVIRYPSVELANSSGKQAADDQTEYVEPLDGIKYYGDKVEKTECRGLFDYPPPYSLTENNLIGIERNLFLNKNTFIEESKFPLSADCPRREPLYRVYIIEGNLVFLGELLRKEDLAMVTGALETLIMSVRGEK